MEPSQIFGGAEECHSSESGWTMYIGSPIDDSGHSDDGDNDNRDDEDTQADPESDDSMASDACSGPKYYRVNHSFAGFQQDDAEEEYDGNKFCLDKKANNSKTQEKQMKGKKVERKETLFIDSSKGKSPVQGSGKVRKNYLVGKRK